MDLVEDIDKIEADLANLEADLGLPNGEKVPWEERLRRIRERKGG